jgi:hypothetical protein
VLFDADLNMRSWAPQRFPCPDIINPGRLFVQTEVNAKLRKYPLQIALTLNEHGETRKAALPDKFAFSYVVPVTSCSGRRNNLAALFYMRQMGGYEGTSG